ncbi:MAG: helix-turn-helix domain-containing protein [Chloroflexi bacterium]|nr:helix-turn-helix domain-containing protein [Chloroflexota bacterium]
MPIRTRRNDDARNRARRLAHDLGDELRAARHLAGVTQRRVAAAIGSSQAEVSRRERGRSPGIGLERLVLHGAALGLRVSVRLWPVGGALRDAAQARYIAAFVARIGRPWKVRLEAPIPTPGDLRAVDVLLSSADGRIAVEVITRLADLQAQLRAAEQKARDIGATRTVLIVAATHANRRAVAEARPALLAAFDLDARRVLADLAAGRIPPRDALVLFAP